MANGKVKWFNLKKGYGFIQPEEGDKDIFVHISAVKDSGMEDLDEGQELEFEIVENNEAGFAFPSQSLYVEKLSEEKTEIFNPQSTKK